MQALCRVPYWGIAGSLPHNRRVKRSFRRDRDGGWVGREREWANDGEKEAGAQRPPVSYANSFPRSALSPCGSQAVRAARVGRLEVGATLCCPVASVERPAPAWRSMVAPGSCDTSDLFPDDDDDGLTAPKQVLGVTQ